MAASSPPPSGQRDWDLLLSLLHLLFALLLCAVYAVFVTSFGGEFLIVIKGGWILPLFLALLVGGAIGGLVLSLRGRRAGRRLELPADGSWSEAARSAWLVGWAVWDLSAAVPILLVGKVLALGALGSVPSVLIAVLLLPFVGLGALFVVSSISSLAAFAGDRRTARLRRGAVASGSAFLWVFGAFAIVSAAWRPQWSDGVIHAPLFSAGEEPGRGYRIPAMLVLPCDTLLAFAESRVNAMSDLLDINLVMKRSLDGGLTWGELVVIQDVGRQTVHSPCPVYDAATETVWLPYCIDYERLLLVESRDAGLTWSEPRDLTQELGLPQGTGCHNGPGNGIQLSSGRLVIPTSLGGSRALYSDDHGVSWAVGEPIGRGGEPQVFERADGALCANLRNERGASRIVSCSRDGGRTWGMWSFDDELPDAGTQASILRLTGGVAGGTNRLLFSNPGAPYRGEFTIRLSYDEGESWAVAKLVYGGAAGYSQLAVLSDDTILALFETGRFDLRESITLARVSLDWLTDGLDRVSPP